MVATRSLIVITALALMVPVARLHAAPQWGIPGPSGSPSRSSQYASPAYDQGYQRGVRAGDEDGRRGQSFNFTDESDYRRADTGYRSQYGNRGRYQDQFRVGYEQGYRAGYARYGYNGRNGSPWSNGQGAGRIPNGNYGGNYNGGYNQGTNVAFENGFTDGYDEGGKDGRGRRVNEPVAESRYRSGDHGFNSRYGSRDVYKNTYRQGFLQGYDRGYREGRNYR